MIINSTKDIISFFISLLVGVGLCVFYDTIKSIRLANKSKKISVFFQDILFFLISSLVTYTLLFVRAQGEIRWFILAAEFIGFLFFRIYLSKFLINFLKKTIIIIKSKIIFPLIKFAAKIINFLNAKLDKIFVKI